MLRCLRELVSITATALALPPSSGLSVFLENAISTQLGLLDSLLSL